MNSRFLTLLRMISTYDYWILGITVIMLSISIMLVASAGSAVALTHQWNTFFFIKKHIIFMIIAIIACIGCTFLTKEGLLWFGYIALLLGMLGVLATFFVGTAIKGAYRWLNILGFSIQPSELMKFGVILTSARLIYKEEYNSAGIIAALCMLLLIIQPDFGSLMLVCGVLLTMAFVNGLRWIYLGVGVCIALSMAVVAYVTLPHVFKRVDIFINKKEDKYGSNYQIIKATQAFKTGGLMGKGPGEGYLKYYLPDAHADFIFAVAGEEFGLFGNLVILCLYIILLFRIFVYAVRTKDNYILLVIVGLGSHMLLQAWFNILSNLALIPTKGFTLPIIGYGGSGLIANMCAIGVLLNVTRKQNYSVVLKKYD